MLPAGYGMPSGYGTGSNISRLTSAPALPAGWQKVGPGLWKHENGEESRINPASLETNNNFGMLVSESGKFTESPGGRSRAMTPAGGDRQPGAVFGAQEASSKAAPAPAPPPPPPASLPPNWQEVWDSASQHIYYYNHETKLSSWERPVAASANPLHPPPPPSPPRSATMEPHSAEPVKSSQVEPVIDEARDEPEQLHAVGDVVTVQGLQSRPEFNGYKAVVDLFDADKGRYMVRVVTGVGVEAVTISLKAANLSDAGPPPPPPPKARGSSDSTSSHVDAMAPPPPPSARHSAGEHGAAQAMAPPPPAPHRPPPDTMAPPPPAMPPPPPAGGAAGGGGAGGGGAGGCGVRRRERRR